MQQCSVTSCQRNIDDQPSLVMLKCFCRRTYSFDLPHATTAQRRGAVAVFRGRHRPRAQSGAPHRRCRHKLPSQGWRLATVHTASISAAEPFRQGTCSWQGIRQVRRHWWSRGGTFLLLQPCTVLSQFHARRLISVIHYSLCLQQPPGGVSVVAAQRRPTWHTHAPSPPSTNQMELVNR